MTCWHAVSRAWRKLHVLTSSSNWFIVLFVFIVIGPSNNFGFLVLWQSIENILEEQIANKIDTKFLTRE